MLDKVFIEFDVVVNPETEEEVVLNGFNAILVGNIYEAEFHKNVLQSKYEELNPNIEVKITSIREV
jgi:hypothetical protein